MKICLISSSGGHYEQLMRLKPLINKYSGFVVTEKTKIKAKGDYYLPQINRKEILFIFKLIIITFKSLYIFLKERPTLVISTGAMCCIPMCFIAKVFRRKVVFIESFAKINSPTVTGKLLYKYVDLFIVQWEEMKEFYPEAIYGGSIY